MIDPVPHNNEKEIQFAQTLEQAERVFESMDHQDMETIDDPELLGLENRMENGLLICRGSSLVYSDAISLARGGFQLFAGIINKNRSNTLQNIETELASPIPYDIIEFYLKTATNNGRLDPILDAKTFQAWVVNFLHGQDNWANPQIRNNIQHIYTEWDYQASYFFDKFKSLTAQGIGQIDAIEQIWKTRGEIALIFPHLNYSRFAERHVTLLHSRTPIN